MTPSSLRPLAVACSLLILFLFTSISSLSAQEVDSLQATDPEVPAVENALLWEITGNGLRRPSYLFGTIHLIPKDSFFVTDVMQERMVEASRLVLEVELDGQAIFGSFFGMMLPPDQPLEKLLSAEDYEYLQSFMEDSMPDHGVALPMMMVEKIKPIFSAQQIASSFCDGQAEEQMSYELYLTEYFTEADLPVTGLETASEQMEALDNIPLEEQAAQLMETVRNPREMCGQYGEMVTIYRRQDLQSLMALTESDPTMGNHLDNLLDRRNKNWIPKINEMIKEDVLFIAVGAGHLAGENGVINLMRGQGYTLKPLKDEE